MKVHALDEVLLDHPFFAGLAPELVAELAGCSQLTRVGPGRHLFEAGGSADRFFLIRRGRLGLSLIVPGRGAVTVATASRGEIVDGAWLIPPYRWTFDGVAADDLHVVEIQAQCLRDHAAADPVLGYALMQRFASANYQRLTSALMRLIDLYGNAPAR